MLKIVVMDSNRALILVGGEFNREKKSCFGSRHLGFTLVRVALAVSAEQVGPSELTLTNSSLHVLTFLSAPLSRTPALVHVSCGMWSAAGRQAGRFVCC